MSSINFLNHINVRFQMCRLKQSSGFSGFSWIIWCCSILDLVKPCCAFGENKQKSKVNLYLMNGWKVEIWFSIGELSSDEESHHIHGRTLCCLRSFNRKKCHETLLLFKYEIFLIKSHQNLKNTKRNFYFQFKYLYKMFVKVRIINLFLSIVS